MSLESVIVWQVIAGIVSIGLSVGACLYVQRRADRRQLRRHDVELIRWAREDGLPDGNVEQLRAFYSARYPSVGKGRRPSG